jgi:hypothetical protein
VFSLRSHSKALCVTLMLVISPALKASTSYTLPSGEVLKDPTRPYAAQAQKSKSRQMSSTKFTLNYIMASGQNRRAMINGKAVREGDYVSGARVSNIASDSVTIVVNGNKRRLGLSSVKSIRKN